MELLKNVDPKEYEKYARMYGITDFRGLLQAFELLKQSQEEETHRLVWPFVATSPKGWRQQTSSISSECLEFPRH
jgi:hypothetical protein